MMMNTFGRKPGFPSRGMIEPPERESAEVVAEKILEFLGTGKSCKLEEIARAVELPEDRIKNILDFLAGANLVEKRFRITSFGLKLLKMPTG
jgi:predicted transcriptional regulator